MRWKVVGIGAAVVVVVVAVLAALFVWPTSARPAPADAVVVFAGGQGERLQRAVELVDAGMAPVLVISNGNASGWAAANRLCRPPQPFVVICPSPATTRGEARMVGDLARERGWHRVMVVTSTYHVRRASVLSERCVPAATDVTVVAARPSSLVRPWFAIPHEAAGLVEALTRRGRC